MSAATPPPGPPPPSSAEPPAYVRAYARPDLDAAEREASEFAAACARAGSGDELVALVVRWNALRSRLDTARQIAQVRYHQDTRDPAARLEQDFWNDASPRLRALDALHARTLLASPHKGALDRAFGPQFLALKRCAAAAFEPALADAIREEAKLTARYTELMAEAAIEFQGAWYNPADIARFFAVPDRDTRRDAHRARDAFLAARGEELDAIFDRLVKLRDAMGRALGRPHFTPLGYELLGRTGYGPAEVARFRDEIRRELVPLASELYRAQAARLGVSRLMYWDEGVARPEGNPRPRGDAAFCLAQTRAMYRAFGPAFEAFIETLVARGQFDLDNRAGKAGGGFCAGFADLGVPFVFANYTGTDTDLLTLVHECGHAFQWYESRAAQPLLEYYSPTFEAAEVHSMGMEYLAGPWMELFFLPDDARRFERQHLEYRLLGLPYMAAVDHFQHEVYARPHLTPAERRALWRELEHTYLPHRDYGGEGPSATLPYLAAGGLWQRQLHIFDYPFYYIDYALAQACAMQLWRRARADRATAMDDYVRLCRAGGSQDFESLVRLARLRSPLEPECLREVIADVRDELLAPA